VPFYAGTYYCGAASSRRNQISPSKERKMNKAQKITASVTLALLVFAMWASAGLSQDIKLRGSRPTDNAGARVGTPPSEEVHLKHKGMRAEERLVRDVYARLMRYHTAARDELAAREGKASRPDDYLTFELQDIHTGLIAAIAGRSPGELITGGSGELIKIRPFHLSNGDGPAHAYYEAEWSTEMETRSSETAEGSDYATLEEMLHRSGDKFAGSDRYVSYQVTVRLNGRQRTYRALVLSRHDDATAAEIFDNITSQMNAVLRDESPRVRSPWSNYVKSSLYLAVARTIRETKASGRSLIPADAPIGYLPGDDVSPNEKDLQIMAANTACVFVTFRASVVNPPVVDDVAATIAGTQFTFQIEAVNAQGERDTTYNGAVTVTCDDGLSQGESINPGTITLSQGVATTQVLLVNVPGTHTDKHFSVTPSGGSAVSVGGVNVWFNVVATREGLVGGTTACGHTITVNDHFVALPSTGLCNTTVRVRNGNNVENTTVRDVGPWYPHAQATQGNPCQGGNDAYWNGTGVPRVEGQNCDSNDAGIDLADGTYNGLGVNGPARVLWRFR
jgi:hypothetical protein